MSTPMSSHLADILMKLRGNRALPNSATKSEIDQQIPIEEVSLHIFYKYQATFKVIHQ